MRDRYKKSELGDIEPNPFKGVNNIIGKTIENASKIAMFLIRM